jgi:hypothetical protein
VVPYANSVKFKTLYNIMVFTVLNICFKMSEVPAQMKFHGIRNNIHSSLCAPVRLMNIPPLRSGGSSINRFVFCGFTKGNKHQ